GESWYSNRLICVASSKPCGQSIYSLAPGSIARCKHCWQSSGPVGPLRKATRLNVVSFRAALNTNPVGGSGRAAYHPRSEGNEMKGTILVAVIIAIVIGASSHSTAAQSTACATSG